jgi:hypothetical protein
MRPAHDGRILSAYVPLHPSQPLYRDGKRVLECLQKSLRIASSCIDEVMSVQLYVDALDQYLYYFEQNVEAVSKLPPFAEVMR